MPRLSAVVITHNEEQNLPNLLGSLVGWVDEIIVVDSESKDRTVAIAESFGGHVYPYPRTTHVDEARAFALAQATGDWILSVDADEMVAPPLARRIREWIGRPDADIYRIPRLNYGMGQAIHGARWGPEDDRPMALFRRGSIRATPHIHGFYHPVSGARLARPPYVAGEHIHHFSMLSMGHYLDKTNRYTTLEALDQDVRHALPTPTRVLARAARTFVSLYFLHGGRKDGWRGLAICASAAFYVIAAYAKGHELRDGLDEAAVRTRYQATADAILAQYEAAGLGGHRPEPGALPPLA